MFEIDIIKNMLLQIDDNLENNFWKLIFTIFWSKRFYTPHKNVRHHTRIQAPLAALYSLWFPTKSLKKKKKIAPNENKKKAKKTKKNSFLCRKKDYFIVHHLLYNSTNWQI